MRTSAEYIEIDGRFGFVEQAGEGEHVIFCVHTAGQHGFQWRAARDRLAQLGYRVVVVDLPGHGRSDPAEHGPVSDLGWYADWCLTVIDRISLDRPYLLGCSIGGKIVLDMAVKASARLSGVVSMAAYGQRGGRGRSARPWGLEDASSPSNRDRSYYGYSALTGRSVPAEQTELLALMHCREDWHVTVSDQSGWSRHDIWDELGTIACPVRLVVGEDDFGVPATRVEQTAARIPGARWEVVPGIGHFPMQEMPDFGDHAHAWFQAMCPAVLADR
ncbi:MAG TPA: alpha/beta hydrolase [Pseudonocardiaceae bacterium]|jgi:pimeloyl-ACP methyl ester carboxylesterase|nr:alpha/beta hydrolase [Pseudonocardiaceae bacterium]